jgi:putative spermidine/putrescine transport system permease protein/spermidine/putrescine transport system permease protein
MSSTGNARPLNVARLAASRRRENIGRILLAGPALALVGGVLFLPLAWLLYQSFLGPSGVTLQNYAAVVQRPAYLNYLQTTLRLSLGATFLCVLLAYPICYAMVVARRAYGVFLFGCVVCAFFSSYLVRTYAWLLLLQRRGIINTFLLQHGIVDRPLELVYNFSGTLLGMVHVLLPLMILPLYASMKAVDPTLVKAAIGLGATPSRAFRDVFAPLSAPGLAAGAVLVFILSLGFYLTPAILGGGRVVVWATAIASAAEEDPVWGASSALGIVLLVSTFALLYLLKALFRVKSLVGARG